MRKLTYVFTILICILLGSCRTSRQEPSVVDHVKIDTVRMYSHSTDSIYLHDSIYTVVRGDTVTTDRWHTLVKYIERTDTMYQSRTDSIPVPYPVTKEVKFTPWYMKALASVGALIIGIFLFIVVIKVNKSCF